MFSKIALFLTAIVAVLVASSTTVNFADAQATVLTTPGSGKTSTVTGTPISLAMYNNATLWGMFAPFAYTSAEIAASTGDMVLVHTNGQSPKAFEWNVIWNFTSAEAATIRSWAAGISLRNNVVVSFTATWDANGRFAIETASWQFAMQSLMPYGLTLGCNITALAYGNRVTIGLLPAPCATVLVPAQKQLAITQPQCLMYFARTALEVDSACQTVRAFLETVYCTDGSAGVDAVCTYNHAILPSGLPGPVVLTVGPDGLASSPSSPSGGGSAGAVSTMMMAAVAAFVAALIF